MGPRLHLEPCPGEGGNNCFPTIFAILSARSNSISNDTMWEPFGLTISIGGNSHWFGVYWMDMVGDPPYGIILVVAKLLHFKGFMLTS